MVCICTTIALVVVIALLIYLYLTWNFNYWKKRGVLGPKPKLIVGTTPNMLLQKRNVVYDYQEHYNNYKNTEKFIGAFGFGSPELIILAPELTKEVYVKKFKNFHDNFGAKDVGKQEPLLGFNPFFLTGQAWKDKRAEITPAITVNRIKASYPVMQNVCTKLVDYVKNKIKAEGKHVDFDCRDLSQRFAIQNVSDCIYGIDANALVLEKNSELLKHAKQLMEGLFDFNFIAIIVMMLKLEKLWTKPLIRKETRDFFINLMHDAVELRKKTGLNDRIDFLNYLIQLKEKKGLDDVILQAHSITFFLDGFETSSMVLAHAILTIGRDKEVQNKLRKEIEINSAEDGTISFEKLQELPYLDQCISETLRMYPPVGIAMKLCVEDAELENSNGRKVLVEKETPVTIPIYSFHYDEDIYPNPNKFDPDRFSAENGGEKKYREMGAFLPFGDGPRACLGQKFALAQIKICVSELVRNFEISVSDKTRKDNLMDPKSFLLFLDGGIYCKFTELKN